MVSCDCHVTDMDLSQARRELWRMKFALKAVWAVEVISRAYASYKVGGAGVGAFCTCWTLCDPLLVTDP